MKIGNELISVVISKELDEKAATITTEDGIDLRTKRKMLRRQLEQILEHGVDVTFNIVEGSFKRSFSVHYKREGIHPDYYIDVVDKVIKYMTTQDKQDLSGYVEDTSFLDEFKESVKIYLRKFKRWLYHLSDKMNGLSDYAKDTAAPKLMNGAKVVYGSMQAALNKITDSSTLDYILDCGKATSDINRVVSELEHQFGRKDELQVKAIYDMKQLIIKMQNSQQSVNSVDLLNVILDLTKCISACGEPLNTSDESIQVDESTLDTDKTLENLQENCDMCEKSEIDSTYIIDENIKRASDDFTVETLYTAEVENFMKGIFVKVH